MINIVVSRVVWGGPNPPGKGDFGDWVFWDLIDGTWSFKIDNSFFPEASLQAVRNYRELKHCSFGEVHLLNHNSKACS